MYNMYVTLEVFLLMLKLNIQAYPPGQAPMKVVCSLYLSQLVTTDSVVAAVASVVKPSLCNPRLTQNNRDGGK